jgi:hypothetical protein
MTENKKKLLSFYKFEYDTDHGCYVRKATLGKIVIEQTVAPADVEHLGEEMLCKILSSNVRKMKKALAKQFLMSFNFYELVKKSRGFTPSVINPHFVTDTIIALDIFDSDFNHYLGIVDAKLRTPKMIYFDQKNDRSLDCISTTLRVIARQFISSESGIKKYMPNYTKGNHIMR